MIPTDYGLHHIRKIIRSCPNGPLHATQSQRQEANSKIFTVQDGCVLLIHIHIMIGAMSRQQRYFCLQLAYSGPEDSRTPPQISRPRHCHLHLLLHGSRHRHRLSLRVTTSAFRNWKRDLTMTNTTLLTKKNCGHANLISAFLRDKNRGMTI